MTSAQLTTLASVVLGGGFLGGVAALFKLRPEGDQILISSAKDVVIIQRGALEDLQKQMDAMQDRFDLQARASAGALAECHRERDDLRAELVAERVNNTELRSRIETLESEVAALRAAQSREPGP